MFSWTESARKLNQFYVPFHKQKFNSSIILLIILSAADRYDELCTEYHAIDSIINMLGVSEKYAQAQAQTRRLSDSLCGVTENSEPKPKRSHLHFPATTIEKFVLDASCQRIPRRPNHNLSLYIWLNCVQ